MFVTSSEEVSVLTKHVTFLKFKTHCFIYLKNFNGFSSSKSQYYYKLHYDLLKKIPKYFFVLDQNPYLNSFRLYYQT